MTAPARGLAAALLACLVFALAPTGASAADKAPSPNAQVRSAFKQLIASTQRTPRRAVSRRSRAALVRAARNARKRSRRNPCRANRLLSRYRRGLRRVKVFPKRSSRRQPSGGPSPRGKLRADLLRVQSALKIHPRARRCGGGRAAKVDEASASVLESTGRTLKLRVQLPPPTFSAHQVGGTDYLEMHMEGLGFGGDKGEPSLPAMSSFFGIPEGAGVDLDIGNVQSYTLGGVDLWPTQEQPVDQAPVATPLDPIPDRGTFADKPFSIDTDAYRSNSPYPAQPAHAGPLGMMRDLDVGAVDTFGGQYRPGSERLRVFTSIDVTVNFTGEHDEIFGPDTLLSQWNHAFVDDYATLANLEAVRDRLRPVRPVFCGEELLIVTSSELRPAANTLASQRQAQGYVTSVREVGAGAGQIGTTPAQIRDFIRGRLNGSCLLRPSYVILLGNTAHVPTFLVPCSPGGNPDDCNIASDLDYSLNGIGSDLFADVQLGRLPAPSLDSANALVTKLETYATTNPAPPGDDFLGHAAVTSYFQPPLHCVLNEGATGTPNCDANNPPVTGHWEINYPANTDTRGFTITAERIRNAIAADGYNVDRLYTTDDEDVIPLNYWNGTPIPDHLRRPAFAWDANTTDFFNAYNDGRFVILHRDHGWPDGFAEPTLHSGHVPFFTNGSQQPVVFGINCASAAFDTPAHPSFVELQVLRPDGGAIAGFGDTRVSPSFPNNHMALGFFDAMFPSTVSDYGGPETRRLGDVLVRGKQYMATQEGFEWHGAGDTYVEHYLYHLLGDPTMQMWSNPPVRFDPSSFRGIIKEIRELRPPRPGDPPFYVHFELASELANGTLVTVFRNGNEAIGRGIVQNGFVDIVPEVPFDDQDDLSVHLQQDGALPAQEAVDKNPREDTSLTQTCPEDASYQDEMTTRGRLSPGFAGAEIQLTYTREDGTTFEREATTDQNGDWSDTIRPVEHDGPNPFFEFGDWQVQARFEGDRGHNPSQAQACSFRVND
jgi:Peptidase family C25/Propeptide_C25